MKSSQRLEQAIQKLYSAFHTDALHPECCKSCAVGTICDTSESWKYLTDTHGSVVLNYVGNVHQHFGRKMNGYSPKELLQIEAVFLEGCGYSVPLVRNSKRPENPTDKDVLFNGLSATVAFLCELDDIANVMDYSKLFEFENNKPKHSVTFAS